MTNDTPKPAWSPSIAAIYQEDTTQLRFMKQQQWVITNYFLLVLAAIFGIYTTIDVYDPYFVGAAVVLFILGAVLAIALLLQIQCGMKRSRDRLTKIVEHYIEKPDRECIGLSTREKPMAYDVIFVVPLVAVCIIGPALAVYAMLAVNSQ